MGRQQERDRTARAQAIQDCIDTINAERIPDGETPFGSDGHIYYNNAIGDCVSELEALASRAPAETVGEPTPVNREEVGRIKRQVYTVLAAMLANPKSLCRSWIPEIANAAECLLPPPASTEASALAPQFDFAAHLQRQRDFSERTFGPGMRTKGVCDHIRKELAEIECDPSDLSEWADVVILGLDGFWRAGATPEQIIAVIVAKQTKNESRTWPDWRTADPNKAIEHDRSGDGHSYRRGVPCAACGDLDGCHRWREAQPSTVPAPVPAAEGLEWSADDRRAFGVLMDETFEKRHTTSGIESRDMLRLRFEMLRRAEKILTQSARAPVRETPPSTRRRCLFCERHEGHAEDCIHREPPPSARTPPAFTVEQFAEAWYAGRASVKALPLATANGPALQITCQQDYARLVEDRSRTR